MEDQLTTYESIDEELAALKRKVAELEAETMRQPALETAMQISEERYRMLFDASTDAIFLERLDGRILDCNKAACRIFNYEKAELIGLSVADLVPDEIAATLADVASEHLVTGGIFVEALGKRKSGEIFPTEVSTRLAVLGGGQILVAFVRDISVRKDALAKLEQQQRHLEDVVAARTAELQVLNAQLQKDITLRKQAEAALRAAHDLLEIRVQERTHELAEANRHLQEMDQLKSKFMGDISHELRTPITNLNLYQDLLSRGKPEKRAVYEEALRQSIHRLTRLSEDVINVIRLDLFKGDVVFSAIDLNEVAALVVDSRFSVAQGHGLKLVLQAGESLPFVWAERKQLSQLITNLVENSLNYTKQGQVTVCTAWDAERSQVRLEVADTGVGIGSEDLPHIFERFYRGRTVGQSNIPGTGLGLAVAKDIAVLFGGTIEVHSELNKGSRFTVWLPAAAGID